ncbi:LOW QUALITY PROTEIN: SH3 and cysteine-rich domain-containing protein 2 [Nyctibius grandis]|uniref:LOW QUALITY PROTEIN: SH3 and cysteine-rich domain-containing protein 2 n=1 Tax=Nyctibius grandis TaxID=48427 RepID=UPI0035BC02BE
MTEPTRESETAGTPEPPPAGAGHGSKMQRLKRSLSLRTLLRSKSVESLFPRGVPGPGGVRAPGPPRPPPRPHGCQQHVSKKRCPCELGRQLLAGSSRHGLRCQAGVHPCCSVGISHQRCPGETAASFRRNFSSPLLLPERGGSAQGDPPPAPSARVDPVYEALRFGTSLAHGAGPTELPPGIQGDKVAAGEESGDTSRSVGSPSDSADTAAERDSAEEKSPGQQVAQGPARRDGAPMFSYVALYKFVPQEQQDLALQPGDRVTLVDDSNEDWWKGKVGARLGFFPANFVQRVRPGESVWRSCRAVQGDREQGRMSLRENQICVGVGRTQGLVRVTSGRKRGLVPAEALTEI